MAVIVQYIVVRDGVHKMTFATKKEADAYDKMLDIADDLYDFLETAELDVDDKKLEDISFFLANNKDHVMAILRGTKPKKSAPQDKEKPKPAGTADAPELDAQTQDSEKPAAKAAPKKKMAKKK